MKRYELPELGYDYAAPEPHVSARNENRRADYVKAIWNVVNWNDVAARFERAHSLVGSTR